MLTAFGAIVFIYRHDILLRLAIIAQVGAGIQARPGRRNWRPNTVSFRGNAKCFPGILMDRDAGLWYYEGSFMGIPSSARPGS
jgi:hypothetical protein